MTRREHRCWDPTEGPCSFCESKAEQRQAEREAPLDEGEIQAMENAYEAAMDRAWDL